MVSEEVKRQIEEAVAVLKRGGVVVFPTETAYGLAADATNERAVEKVFAIKGRNDSQSLPLIAASRDMVERYAGIPRGLERFANQYWPGPLTLVLPVMGELANGVVRNGTVAIRVSSHEIARSLSHDLGAPIVSTSANISGQPTSYSVDQIKRQFAGREHQPDFYLDIGPLDPSILPSTIMGVDDYGYPEVIRQGAIEIDV